MKTLNSMVFVAVGACAAALSVSGLATTADAAPSVSSFAGNYGANFQPLPGYGVWTINISDGGVIKGAGGFISNLSGTLSGKVTAVGSLSVTIRWSDGDNGGGGHHDGDQSIFRSVAGDHGAAAGSYDLRGAGSTEKRTATVTLGAGGNLIGVADDGSAFTWTRK